METARPAEGRTLARLAAALLFVLATAGFAATVSAQTQAVPLPRVAPRAGARVPGAVPATGTDANSSLDLDNPEGSVETINGDNPPGDAVPADPMSPAAKASPLDLAAPSDQAPIVTGGKPASFELVARMTDVGAPITTGMTWRVFGPAPGPDGKLKLVVEAHGGSVKLTLIPGAYFVYAAYGRAGATKKIIVGGSVDSDNVVLNAGGLRLTALVGKDQPLAASDVSFDIYAPDEEGSDERVLLVSNAPVGRVVGLNAGTYHVICRYGDANAVVRADIRVEAGKLTEATVYQKAARLTLKLVSEHGGEALADTAWSVVTPVGDSVADSVGAFPSVVLAVGDYTAIAKHDGKIFERNFTVEAGLNRDIEVIATP